MIRQALILCGGLGTRLGALTAATPKPLLEVAGAPFLDVLVEELGRHGFTRVTLLAGHLAEQVEQYARHSQAAARRGVRLDVSPDRPRPCGDAAISVNRVGPNVTLTGATFTRPGAVRAEPTVLIPQYRRYRRNCESGQFMRRSRVSSGPRPCPPPSPAAPSRRKSAMRSTGRCPSR